MSKICWVVHKLKKTSFTGGVYCVLRHADCLARRGHDVTVVTLQPSPNPAWFDGNAVTVRRVGRLRSAWRLFRSTRHGRSSENCVHGVSSALIAIEPRLFPFAIRNAVLCERARVLLPDADVTVATSFETALPVALYGHGKKMYFCQHFEPLFMNELDEPTCAEVTARASYLLPLTIIANSQWLADRIRSETGRSDIAVAGNAIEDSMFATEPPRSVGAPLKVISYGGRGVAWKGFSDMASAVKMARTKGVDIEWSVYGGCDMRSDNETAPFNYLGFLNSEDLALAYKRNAVLLSASWYESFPLFPLEAMAAGLAVITTKPGTEGYARHMETAWVVPPKDPDALCTALIRLAVDAPLRRRLGENGITEAHRHTWPDAAAKMESILLQT